MNDLKLHVCLIVATFVCCAAQGAAGLGAGAGIQLNADLNTGNGNKKVISEPVSNSSQKKELKIKNIPKMSKELKPRKKKKNAKKVKRAKENETTQTDESIKNIEIFKKVEIGKRDEKTTKGGNTKEEQSIKLDEGAKKDKTAEQAEETRKDERAKNFKNPLENLLDMESKKLAEELVKNAREKITDIGSIVDTSARAKLKGLFKGSSSLEVCCILQRPCCFGSYTRSKGVLQSVLGIPQNLFYAAGDILGR